MHYRGKSMYLWLMNVWKIYWKQDENFSWEIWKKMVFSFQQIRGVTTDHFRTTLSNRRIKKKKKIRQHIFLWQKKKNNEESKTVTKKKKTQQNLYNPQATVHKNKNKYIYTWFRKKFNEYIGNKIGEKKKTKTNE